MTPMWLVCLIGLASAQEAPRPPAAEAPEARQRARELYENGERLYEEGEYEGAILAFREALELSGEAVLHFNIANCLERLGRLGEARDELTLYRAVAPAEEAETLNRRISAMDRRIAEAQVATQELPPPPVRRRPQMPLVLSGVATFTLGAGASALTYSESRRFIVTDDRGAYQRVRALNGASWAGMVVGAGLSTVGFVWRK